MPEQPFINTADWIKTPGFSLIRPTFESLLGIGRLNRIYRAVRRDGMSCAGFCTAALEHLRIPIRIETDVRPPDDAPLILLGNHPTGMVEALMLVAVLESLRPDAWKILSNKFVAATPEFSSQAIPLDTFGLDPDPRVNARGFIAAHRFLKGGGSIGAFPAGRVAPANGSNSLPEDSAWSPHLIRLARRSGARVLVASFPLESGKLLRTLPLSLPRLRALFLSREATRIRPETIRIRVSEGPDLFGYSDEDATLLCHRLCHKNLT